MIIAAVVVPVLLLLVIVAVIVIIASVYLKRRCRFRDYNFRHMAMTKGDEDEET